MKRPIFKHFAWIPLLLLAPQVWSAYEGTDGTDPNDPALVGADIDPFQTPAADPLDPAAVEDPSSSNDPSAAPEPAIDGPTFANDAVVFETPALPEDTPAAPPVAPTAPSTAAQPAASGSQAAPTSEAPQPQTFTIAKQEAPKADAPAQPEAEEIDECPITEDVEPLRPDIELSQNLLWMILAAMGLALAGLILHQFLRARKKRKPQIADQTAAAVVKDPLKEALRLLKEAKALLEAEDAQPFAFTLTDAVRPYLSYVFELPAPECTTEEMLVKLPVCEKLTDILRTHIADLLTACDLIKFTPMAFDIDARTKLYQTAETIIQLSTQRREELIEEARKAALAAKEQQAAQQRAALKEKISTLAGMKSISTVTGKNNASKSAPNSTATAQNVKKTTNPTNRNQRKQ